MSGHGRWGAQGWTRPAAWALWATVLAGGLAQAARAADSAPVSVPGAAQAGAARVCGPLPALPRQPPTGARQVTAQGATPDDDVPDDGPIAAALAALRPGDWLVFPPGRYLLAHAMEIQVPGVTLWGRGAVLQATDPGDQTLGVRADGVRVIGFTLRAAMDGRRTTVPSSRLSAMPPEGQRRRLHDVVLRDNRIDSGASAGIYVSGVDGFVVAGNTVTGTLADGIHMTGGATRGVVMDNHVQGVGDDGIAVVSYLDDPFGPVSHVRVEHNEVADLRWARGLSVVGGDDILLRGNRVHGIARAAAVLIAREEGWHTAGVRRVRVEDNQLTAVQPGGAVTGHAAIEVHVLGALGEVQDVRLRGNRITAVSTDAIRIGADSRPGSIRRVQVDGNRTDRIGGDVLAVLLPGALGAVHALVPDCGW